MSPALNCSPDAALLEDGERQQLELASVARFEADGAGAGEDSDARAGVGGGMGILLFIRRFNFIV